ncbi:hypothetical protein BKA56DRAFT_497170 [Ilyonectria sp. MPI-CAGE-AT-0026]|nr:hypothetical protein BKA56DRAFT_497170 [Ilyonectria sp. MPI-CAGE-AT-0026]
MSRKLLVVFGATGSQGGSVANIVLDSPDLSKQYAVRAITRSASNPKAQTLLQRGAEVVEADLDSPSSLKAALAGAHTVFAMTNTQQGGNTVEIETRQAGALCEELINAGAKYVIWSSLPFVRKFSNGKLKVNHFDVKGEIEQRIRALPIKSSFFVPAFFMQNFSNVMAPTPANDGTYVFANSCTESTLMPLIDPTDTGEWVAAILAEPDKYEGKSIAAAQGLYTWSEIAEAVSAASGKVVKFQAVPEETFKGWLPEGLRDDLLDMYSLFRDYGYYGPTMKEDIEWGVKQAKGNLTSLEEFLRREHFQLK